MFFFWSTYLQDLGGGPDPEPKVKFRWPHRVMLTKTAGFAKGNMRIPEFHEVAEERIVVGGGS